MNRQEAKELLPIIQAFAEGKTIEFKSAFGNWTDCNEVLFNYPPKDYRIKPEPTYRPFKNKEECWEEMQKHQPFGWVKYKENIILHVNELSLNCVLIGKNYYFKEAKEEFTFADGTPFGIKE